MTKLRTPPSNPPVNPPSDPPLFVKTNPEHPPARNVTMKFREIHGQGRNQRVGGRVLVPTLGF